MTMSWECTEGPGGFYPGEEGYEEAVDNYQIRRLEGFDSCERRVEKHIFTWMNDDAQLASWIRIDRPLSSNHFNIYLGSKLQCFPHILKINKYTSLVERPGMTDRMSLNTDNARLDISKKTILLIEVELDEDTENIVRGIHASVGHLVIFSTSLPPSACESQYHVLDLNSHVPEPDYKL